MCGSKSSCAAVSHRDSTTSGGGGRNSRVCLIRSPVAELALTGRADGSPKRLEHALSRTSWKGKSCENGRESYTVNSYAPLTKSFPANLAISGKELSTNRGNSPGSSIT